MTTLVFVPVSPFGHILGNNLLMICTSRSLCSLLVVLLLEEGVVSTFAVWILSSGVPGPLPLAPVPLFGGFDGLLAAEVEEED